MSPPVAAAGVAGGDLVRSNIDNRQLGIRAGCLPRLACEGESSCKHALCTRGREDLRRSRPVVPAARITGNHPASCGDCRPILVRDLRGMSRGRRSIAPKLATKEPICRYFTGATGLEPATSGVTGRVGHNDGRGRTPWNGPLCRHFSRNRCTLCMVEPIVRSTFGPRVGHEI